MEDIRQPTKASSLQFLKTKGLLPKTVIDVGVQYQTKELIDVFPESKHVLIEPIEEYREKIKSNYSTIKDKDFVWAAASDTSKIVKLKTQKKDRQSITHSNIILQASSEELSEEEYREIEAITIDELCQQKQFKKPYLLKIDVDGHDLEVLKGARNSFKDVCCIVIEAPLNMNKLLDRAEYLRQNGFVLWDIVDLCYYYGNLSQVDLIFLSSDVKSFANFDPWNNFSFAWDKWVPFKLD